MIRKLHAKEDGQLIEQLTHRIKDYQMTPALPSQLHGLDKELSASFPNCATWGFPTSNTYSQGGREVNHAKHGAQCAHNTIQPSPSSSSSYHIRVEDEETEITERWGLALSLITSQGHKQNRVWTQLWPKGSTLHTVLDSLSVQSPLHTGAWGEAALGSPGLSACFLYENGFGRVVTQCLSTFHYQLILSFPKTMKWALLFTLLYT